MAIYYCLIIDVGDIWINLITNYGVVSYYAPVSLEVKSAVAMATGVSSI